MTVISILKKILQFKKQLVKKLKYRKKPLQDEDNKYRSGVI